MSGVPEKSISGILPPWLWFWLVLYGLSLPGQVALWQQNLKDLFFHQELPTDVTGIHFPFLLRLANMPELMPSLALAVGVLSIFLPWTRMAYLEKRFRLTAPPKSSVLQEISEFLNKYAPDLQIKTNLLRTDQIAFVYPLGYRATAIAIFGRLVKLWRSDRTAAETVLLHELGHYRHGDALIVGVGSFFGTVIKNWLALYFLLCFLPLVLTTADQTLTFFLESRAIGIPFDVMLSHKAGQLLHLILPGMLLQSAGLLFWMVSVIVLPLAGIWCAEFNADRFAADVKKSSRVLMQVLERLSPKTTWWRRLLFLMSHPPAGMRCWAVQSAGIKGLIALLLLFPLTYFVKLLSLAARALSGYFIVCLSGFYGSVDLWQKLSGNIETYLMKIAPIWLFMAALIAVWPIASGYWEQIFCGARGAPDRTNYRGYFLSAIILCIISCYVMAGQIFG
jgi:Zn-dependent protease with chaperone function